MSKLYRISWHTFHGGSDYVDGSLKRLKPVIKHLVKTGTPYRITDENGKVVRDMKPAPGGKIRGQFRKPKRLSNPGRRSIHTAKFDRCVKDVSARGGAKSAAAVCTATIGYKGSVKKGHRRRNPSVLKRKMTEREMAAHIKETHPMGAKISKDQKSLTLDDGSRWVWDSRFERWAMTFPPRSQNPLPSVRKVYYIICAHKGAENYYLARSGKLTRSQSSAARFPTAAAAIDKAKAHLKNYAASRKYRFDLKLAY